MTVLSIYDSVCVHDLEENPCRNLLNTLWSLNLASTLRLASSLYQCHSNVAPLGSIRVDHLKLVKLKPQFGDSTSRLGKGHGLYAVCLLYFLIAAI